MTLQELKQNIELNSVNGDLIIFKTTENDFIAKQYISEISSLKSLEIVYIDNVDALFLDSFSIFGNCTDSTNELRVLVTESFDTQYDISSLQNLVVVVKKFTNKELESSLLPYIVEVPKLVDWQIKDYVYSLGEGADTTDLDFLLSMYGNNIYRLEQELHKIKLFNNMERKYLVKDMIRDGAFSDVSTHSIFNFTNAIIQKDVGEIKAIYEELERMEVNNFGLLTILINNIRNLILVKMSSNPTPENTGLEERKLYAIKKTSLKFTPEQLVNVFKVLLDVDKQVKTGELPTEVMMDYILLKILTV